MADSPDDVAREVARGRSEATPWLVLGSVALTVGVVAGTVVAVLLLLWIVL